jgi:thiamine pyrophosphate-dependent acetolactate synthase large subunit-like protein
MNTGAHTASVPAYEALAHDIKGRGTETVFGLMSDDTALLVATFDAIGVRFVGARHENNAIAMAEGYAAATGRLGIAIIGRGPATANGMHGAVYAQRSGSRVLLIFGAGSLAAPPANSLGPDRKAFNTVGVLHAAGLRIFMPADSASAQQELSNAMAAAENGAVALLLPMNVLSGPVPFDAPAAPPPPQREPASRPARKSAIQAAAGVLQQCRRPLIVAGRGAHVAGARDALIRLAERLGAGLATTLKAKGMFRGHPFDVGMVGSFSHGGGRRLIEQADCILAFGAALNQNTTSYGKSLPADVPLIHVDSVRSNIGRWFHADVAVVADARQAAEQLLEVLPERAAADKPLHSEAMRRWLADFDLASEFKPEPTARTMDPRSFAIELDRLLPQNRNVVYDAGNFLQVVPYLSVPGPDHIKLAGDFASIGMGFGTALGFACGTPDRVTVLVLGDGSFLMTLSELETVAREDIPLVIVVMNDCAYGAELHYLKMRDMPVTKSVFPDIDYAPVAEAFLFQTATVRTLDELRALEPMLRQPERPILLDCKINASIAAPFMLESVDFERRRA